MLTITVHDWHPLGGTQIDGHSIRSSIIEVIDNSDNSNDVDLTPADTGNAKEITFKGSIRVETETETLFKADGVTPEDAPARTRTHYFKADDLKRMVLRSLTLVVLRLMVLIRSCLVLNMRVVHLQQM